MLPTAERTTVEQGLVLGEHHRNKTTLSIDGQTFDVSINKNSFSMALGVSGTQTKQGTDGTGEYVNTTDFNQGVAYHFSK
jgi:hypothetical protein